MASILGEGEWARMGFHSYLVCLLLTVLRFVANVITRFPYSVEDGMRSSQGLRVLRTWANFTTAVTMAGAVKIP